MPEAIEDGQSMSHNYVLPFPKGTFDCVDPDSGDIIISGDLVRAQIELDGLREGDPPQVELLAKVQAWVLERHKKEISETQAWCLTWGILGAFNDFKKKYAGSLMSFSGLEDSVFPPARS